ncbi:hypothetical protein JL720_11672 [Aureococcus anophagefferens]|nr:hypothetical protein JL720_11672 [Aureococcus anophagefferens]
MGVQDFNDWFCIPAFFVLFRETLEAAVLVAVLIQYLNRADAKHLKRQVWLGAAVGGAASVAIGVVILSIYYTQKSTMTTTTAFVVEGGMLGFACVVITYFLVTHLAPGMKSSGSWQVKWERNMDELVQAQIDKTNEYGFFTLVHVRAREGFEAAIFVVGFGAAYRPESMPIPIVTGIFAGVAFGASMFVGTNKMDLSLFFKFSAGFLALIAAGLGSHASYEFQKGEAFGAWACKRICDDVWDLSGEKTFDEYMAYHQNAKYADDYVRAALWDRLSDDSSAKVDPRPALFATATLSDAMAVELALKGAQYQHTWIYSTHELYSALGKCEAGDDIQDADRCGDARAYVDDIVAQMTVPLIQGTLRYAYRSSPEGTAEALGSDGKVWAEFHAFGYALLPASTPATRAPAPRSPRRSRLPRHRRGHGRRPRAGGFAAVKAALESTYACLGITCADVGGLQAGDGSPIEGMGACADGSSIDDGAAYFDALEEIGARPDGDWEEENCDDDEADASWHSYRRLEAEPWYDALVEQVPGLRPQARHRARQVVRRQGQSIAWPNEEVWDITGCCDTKNGFFFLMMVLFWYRPAITNLELIIWVIYWPIIAFWGWYKVRDITDFNADLQAAADAKGEEDLKPEAE